MEITRIFDLLENYQNNYTEKEDALVAKENGKWLRHSSKEYVQKANLLSCGLISLGLKKGDRIATVSNNRPEWNFFDMAMAQIGVINVPVYPTISEADFEYILGHSAPRLLVASDKKLYEKLKPIVEKISSIEEIYTFNKLEGVHNWEEIVELGKDNESACSDKLGAIKDSVVANDVATIIYTSGTTGDPKGVMLSHKNILSNVRGIEKVFNFNQTHRTLSFLPISHVYERTINYYFQSKGVAIFYAESLGAISNNLKEVRPHVFIAVPRVLERVYDRIIGKGKDLKGIKKQIFFWAVNLGLRYDVGGENNRYYKLKLQIADKLVFSKWRDALGGCVGTIVVGGAAMQPRLIKVFNAARIPVLEGYGMTETAPVIATNNHESGEVKVGTVGPILPGVEVKISDDGEILTKSDSVMLGYYKDDAQTQETIEPDGWLHTGDVGVMVDNKFLKITDRKKEIFKLSSGKYIAPQSIENQFKESFFIEQVYVFGENQKFASALISPNFQFLHEWCSRHHVKYRDNLHLIQMPEIIQRYQKEVAIINKSLGQTECVKRFRLVQEEWTPQTGELSPTLKLKRRFLLKKYEDLIEEIYSVDNIGK